MWSATFWDGLKDIGVAVKNYGDYFKQKGYEKAKKKKNEKSWKDYDGQNGEGEWTKLQVFSLLFAGVLFVIYLARGR